MSTAGEMGGGAAGSPHDLQMLEDLYPGEEVATLAPDRRDLLPRDKDDFARVERVVALGYPKVGPLLPHLLTRLQDINWPIARRVGSFLASVGAPVVRLVREVLRGDDDVWEHWALRAVVIDMAPAVAGELRADLERLAAVESEEDVHLDVAEVLAKLA